MNIQISGGRMTSADTSHRAERISAREDLWRLSWLPRARLTRNQAITGMVLAVTLPAAMASESRQAREMRAHARSWAGELGLTVNQAYELIIGAL